ncbi:MAG TPA: hypothetical protein PLV92_28065, partial [Pirellulaceae bacterium]|nr:hypothetical protein [Pirellulaceae bacterium]
SQEGNELRSFSLLSDTPAESRPAAGIKLLATRVALTADGQFILAGDSIGQLHRWDASGTKTPGK